ncbi:MucR family transcriptional regulator [Mesorhizobium sp. L-8-10]|uniref:MucR family transcriptional regulator n=1 Tax=Mesorhizobium sp. L-8-10 TaxID=2744523 RepID=UPI0019280509|nr:MucR family transcriptional regulator [Mesorhizobium sp. L-8-10]BCH33260.1 MucR family transcriptional regulator [Mesorhizobium sp. L-8-10]
MSELNDNILAERELILLDYTTQIVCATVTKNLVSPDAIVEFIGKVHSAVSSAVIGTAPAPAQAPQEPAVPIKKSVSDDFIICLEDGKKFKSLKRHLMAHYDLTPEQYRKKWGLAADYPMVAANYAARRSVLAKASGLGKRKAA